MTIFECDFCRKQKPCTKVQIAARRFDLCDSCNKSLEKKLEGRGEAVYQQQFGWGGSYTVYNSPGIFTTPTVTLGGGALSRTATGKTTSIAQFSAAKASN